VTVRVDHGQPRRFTRCGPSGRPPLSGRPTETNRTVVLSYFR
jgi:hypothetical protein